MTQTNPSLAPQIINLSLGAEDDGDPDDPVRVACRAAIQQGIWVLAGAGNDGPDPGTINCPACEEYVMAVGSVGYVPETNSFEVSSFSSRGPTREGLVKPDAVLFGENIVVASNQSDTATATKSGTSFAAPLGSGGLALYLEAIAVKATGNFPLTPQAVANPYQPDPQMAMEYLPSICLKPAGAPVQKDNAYGYGMPFGPLMMNTLSTVAAAADMGSLISDFLMPVVGIALVGMVAKQALGV